MKFTAQILIYVGSFFLASCASRNSNESRVAAQQSPRCVRISGRAAEPYAALCRDAFNRVAIRRDISIRGPIVYRDTSTNQVISNYALGFMSLFVVRFDASKPPKIADTYFESCDTGKRTTKVPNKLKHQ